MYQQGFTNAREQVGAGLGAGYASNTSCVNEAFRTADAYEQNATENS